jgi:hypothetical protein
MILCRETVKMSVPSRGTAGSEQPHHETSGLTPLSPPLILCFVKANGFCFQQTKLGVE